MDVAEISYFSFTSKHSFVFLYFSMWVTCLTLLLYFKQFLLDKLLNVVRGYVVQQRYE